MNPGFRLLCSFGYLCADFQRIPPPLFVRTKEEITPTWTISIDDNGEKVTDYKPKVKIIAASMKRGPSMYESLKLGKPVDVKELVTLADCLGGSIGIDNKYTFKIAQETIDDFVLVDEDKIAEGIKLNFVEHKLVTEGAAATAVMVVKDNMTQHLGKNIICLICGGNIDSELFTKIIQ